MWRITATACNGGWHISTEINMKLQGPIDSFCKLRVCWQLSVQIRYMHHPFFWTFLEMEQASSGVFGGLAPPYSPGTLFRLIPALTPCCTVLISRSQNGYSCPRKKMLPNLCMAPSSATSCSFSVYYHQPSLAGCTVIPLPMFETCTLSLFSTGLCRST